MNQGNGISFARPVLLSLPQLSRLSVCVDLTPGILQQNEMRRHKGGYLPDSCQAQAQARDEYDPDLGIHVVG